MTLHRAAPPDTRETPAAATYRARLTRSLVALDRSTRRWRMVGNVRLGVFALFSVTFVLGAWLQSIPWLTVSALALLVFAGLVVYHDRLAEARTRANHRVTINDEALARLHRQWGAFPVRHSSSSTSAHPYAADLDLFGRASIMRLLESAGNGVGESTLARWLTEPATPATIVQRQSAARELAPLIELRENLLLHDRLLPNPRPDPEALLAWAEGSLWLARRRWLLWYARASVVTVWALIALQVAGVVPWPLWGVVVAANLVALGYYGGSVGSIIDRSAGQNASLRYVAESFDAITAERWQSSGMVAIANALTVDRVGAGDQLRRLSRLARLAVPRSAIVYVPLQALTLWDIHVLDRLERWQAQVGQRARQWFDALGQALALSAFATLVHDHPDWRMPTVSLEATAFDAVGLGHPLIASDRRVANDVTVGPPGTFLLVTGSNMSGKSTLLRAIGVNAVLALAGGPVCASALTMPPVRVWTSMRITDSLEGGVSLFMAELQRLKAVLDAARATPANGAPLLFLLDEILHGTNTAERQIAARSIVSALVRVNAIGAVSTHDLDLANSPDLADAARPVHFSERFERLDAGPTMTFDYRLRQGVATSTNALRLMEIVGIDAAPRA